MDLFDVVRSCLRRWYVVLPLLVIAAGLSYESYTTVKPVYYSQAVVGVAPPNTQVVQAPPDQFVVPRNGLLDAGGASLIANMVAIGLSDRVVAGEIVARGGEANYKTRMFPVPASNPELPLILVETTRPNRDAAINTVKLVVEAADSVFRMLQQQAGVPEQQMAKPLIVSPPSVPTPGIPSRTRSTVAILAVGIGLAVLAGVIIDVLVRRRAELVMSTALFDSLIELGFTPAAT